jgi:hypothetical protein
MRRFLKWYDDDLKGTTYIESDDDNIASKQVTVTSYKYIASNRKDEEIIFI